jgi:hypothetical protein
MPLQCFILSRSLEWVPSPVSNPQSSTIDPPNDSETDAKVSNPQMKLILSKPTPNWDLLSSSEFSQGAILRTFH